MSCGAQVTTSVAMTSATRSAAAVVPREPSAIAMSRSVMTPHTSVRWFTTGTMPQSASHMMPVASASVAVGWQLRTAVVIVSCTFMAIPPG